MSGDEKVTSFGAKPEFDEEREKDAIEKMRRWDHGDDPLLKSLGGEPWWKSFCRPKSTKTSVKKQK